MNFNDYFYKVKFKALPLPKEVADVYNQACRHVYRDPDTSLWDKRRPTEPPNIQQWRKENRRNISSDLPDTYLAETISAIQQNGFKYSEVGDKTNLYLSEEKINVLNNSLTIDEWLLKSILPEAIMDANAYYIQFPKPTTEALTPHLQNALTPIYIEHRIIPSFDIRMLEVDKPGGVFCFERKEKRLGKDVKYTYLVDSAEWVRVWEEGNEMKIETWYVHNLGFIPAKILPGKQAKTKSKVTYQETLLKSMYNILDEFATQFDDDKVMRAKGAHQILVMPEVACNGCGGEKYVKNEFNLNVPCQHCGGSGKMRNPGPADTFIVPTDTSGLATSNRVVPMFIGPDIGTLDHSWTVTWDLWNKAANTKGIDAIQNVAESGEAMKMRLLKNEKSINEAYQKMCDVYEFALNCIEGYLYPDPKDRIQITVQKNNKIEIKTGEILKLKYDEALTVEKSDAAIEYFKVKYQNDPVKVKKYEILVKYFPASLLNSQELTYEVGLQVYTEEDIRRARFAGEALDQILDENNITKSNLDLYKLAKLKIDEIINS